MPSKKSGNGPEVEEIVDSQKETKACWVTSIVLLGNPDSSKLCPTEASASLIGQIDGRGVDEKTF
ncbi:MAG: hypothetical protein Q9184_003695 [Pyrenodesmia sp. 2 TL-2023]